MLPLQPSTLVNVAARGRQDTYQGVTHNAGVEEINPLSTLQGAQAAFASARPESGSLVDTVTGTGSQSVIRQEVAVASDLQDTEGDAIQVGTLTYDGVPTPEQVALWLPVTGTVAQTAVASCRRKLNGFSWGGTTEVACHQLYRIQPALQINTPVYGGAIEDGFAWTIFDLVPGTAYDFEVTVTEPGKTTNVQTLTYTTRSLPAVAGAPNKTANSQATIVSQLAGLNAGDVLEIANGTYTAPAGGFLINRSGTLGSPIYIRGQSRTGTILNLTGLGGRIFNLLTSGHVVIENMTLQGFGVDGATDNIQNAFGTSSSNALYQYITIRNLLVSGIDGFVDLVGRSGPGSYSQGMLVYNNTAVGNNLWTTPFLYTNATWNDHGIQIPGRGNCAFNNTMTGFGDTFSFAEHSSGAECDSNAVHYYRNEIRNSCDDVIEADHGRRNCTWYDNRTHNSVNATSLDPIYAGPIIFARNITINLLRARPHKWNSTNCGHFLYNNTVMMGVVNDDNDGIYGDMCSWWQANNGGQRSFAYQNNVHIYRGASTYSGNMSLRFDNAASGSSPQGNYQPMDWTHNSWYPDRSLRIPYNDIPYTRDTLAILKADRPSGTSVFSGLPHLTEDHITVSNPWVDTITMPSPDSRTEYVGVAYPTPAIGSSLKNSGIIIPGINDLSNSGVSLPYTDRGAALVGYGQPLYGDQTALGFTIQRTGVKYPSLQKAIAAAIADDVIVGVPGRYIPDQVNGYDFTTRLNKNNLLIKSSVPGQKVIIDATSVSRAGGAAIIYLSSGMSAILEDIEVTGNKYRENFNTGIGTEINTGTLTLRRCRVSECSNGITNSNQDFTCVMLLEDCEIVNCGTEYYRHTMYIGSIESLTMRGCWNHNTKTADDYVAEYGPGNEWRAGTGHLVKSRARTTLVEACRITMEETSLYPEDGANKCFDISNGGDLTIRGCLIEFRTSQNGGGATSLIYWAPEGSFNLPNQEFEPSRTFKIKFQQNTVVARCPYVSSETNKYFLSIYSQYDGGGNDITPEPSEYVMSDNIFVGFSGVGAEPWVMEHYPSVKSTTYAIPPATNTWGALGLLTDVANYDYTPVTPVNGTQNWCAYEYSHPASTVARTDSYRGGVAFESGAQSASRQEVATAVDTQTATGGSTSDSVSEIASAVATQTGSKPIDSDQVQESVTAVATQNASIAGGSLLKSTIAAAANNVFVPFHDEPTLWTRTADPRNTPAGSFVNSSPLETGDDGIITNMSWGGKSCYDSVARQVIVCTNGANPGGAVTALEVGSCAEVPGYSWHYQYHTTYDEAADEWSKESGIRADNEILYDPRGTFTANVGTNKITAADFNGENLACYNVRFTSTGTLPAPLQVGVDYNLRRASGDNPPQTTDPFEVWTAAYPSTARVTLTDVGTGTHTVYDQPKVCVHLLNTNAIDVIGRRLFKKKCREGSRILVKNLTTGTWNCLFGNYDEPYYNNYGALEYIPELDRIWIWTRDNGNGDYMRIVEVNPTTGAVSFPAGLQAADFGNVTGAGYACPIVYNPLGASGPEVMVGGQGTQTWRVNVNTKVITDMGQSAYQMSTVYNAQVVANPIGPGWYYVSISPTPRLYFHNGSTGPWTLVTTLPTEVTNVSDTTLVCIPKEGADDYGALMLFGGQVNTSGKNGHGCWIYKTR